MAETEGRKSLRVRIEGLEQKMGALEGNCNGNDEGWCKQGEGDTKIGGLRLWIVNMVVTGKAEIAEN